MLLVTFFKRLGYQCCVSHLGITTVAFVLPLHGKYNRNSVFHLIEKALTGKALEFTYQLINPTNKPINLLIYAGDKKV